MKQVLGKLKSINAILWFLLVYLVLCFLFIPNFRSAYNIRSTLSQVCVILIVGCGLTFCFLNGGLDFSVTSIIALSGVIGASIMSESVGLLKGQWYAVPVAIIAMIGVGLCFGIVNGLSIIMFKMPSFIVTMATQMIGSGLALLYTKSITISLLPESFTKFGTGKIWNIPYTFLFAVLLVFITSFILNKTRLGRQIYAVGTNPKASEISGIPVKKTIFKIYIISSICASLGAIVMIAQMESAAASFANNMFLDFQSAVIIGGTSPNGGSGKISGTFMGAFLIILINVSMNLLGIDWYVISIIKGIIILVAASAELTKNARARA